MWNLKWADVSSCHFTQSVRLDKTLKLMRRAKFWLYSQDNPDLFAMMEKTRMYIFRGTDPEEPIISSGHICTFEAMQVRSILLDVVLQNPENPTQDLVFDLDIKVSLCRAVSPRSKTPLPDFNNEIVQKYPEKCTLEMSHLLV